MVPFNRSRAILVIGLLFPATGSLAIEAPRGARPVDYAVAGWGTPLDGAALGQVTALGLGEAANAPARDLGPEPAPRLAADLLIKAPPRTIAFAALINGNETTGTRQERTEVFALDGRGDMALEQHDQRGNTSRIVQSAVVALQPAQVPGGQTMGAIVQSAAHDFPGGSQSAINIAVGFSFRDVRGQ